MKPKPISLRRQFTLLHSAAIAISLWLLCGAGFLTWKAHQEMTGSAEHLHAALNLDFEVLSVVGEIGRMVVLDHHHAAAEPPPEYFELDARLKAALAAYQTLSLSKADQQSLDTAARLSGQLSERVAYLYRSGDQPPADANQVLTEIEELRSQIHVLLRATTDNHVDQLQLSAMAIDGHLVNLTLLLMATLLCLVLVTMVFQRAHQEGIWKPLETLRQMVMEVRRGNLEVHGCVPRAVETGPLIESFTAMAHELHEMRERLEQKVRERTSQLEETQHQLFEAAKQTALGRMVSGVAHEVNNPLTSILGFAEVLAENPALSTRDQRHVHTIREEALRVKKVVMNLSTFARQGPQRNHRVNLNTVLEQLVDLRRYHLTANKIRMHFQPATAPLWVAGDADQFAQMLFNLLQNAEQAVTGWKPEGGDIWLSGGRNNGTVWVELRDNGCGIPLEARRHVFEPFFTTRPVGEGMGLGLSVADGIARQYQGHIQVESEPGEGTTLRVSLPAAGPETSPPPEEPPVEATESGDKPQPPSTEQLLALVIDDEVGILRLVETALTRRGFRCVALSDSTQVETVLHQPFQLVVCDLKMPQRTGIEVFQLLQQRAPRLARRFLLMTGNLADAEEKELRALGGLPILRKPFTLAKLEAAVHAILTRDA